MFSSLIDCFSAPSKTVTGTLFRIPERDGLVVGVYRRSGEVLAVYVNLLASVDFKLEFGLVVTGSSDLVSWCYTFPQGEMQEEISHGDCLSAPY